MSPAGFALSGAGALSIPPELRYINAMDTTAKPDRMTAEEFLAWAEEQDSGRFQLIRGCITAMAPERADHARAKKRVATLFDEAIRQNGLNCEAFVDGLGIRIDDGTVYEPDVLVNCGDTLADDSLLAPHPVVVVEVISPYSVRRDTKAKLIDYFTHPYISHYLILYLDRQLVLHHQKGEAGKIVTTIANAGDTLNLQPPGFSIRVSALFGNSSDYSSSSS